MGWNRFSRLDLYWLNFNIQPNELMRGNYCSTPIDNTAKRVGVTYIMSVYWGEGGTSGTVTQMVLAIKDYLFYEDIGSIITRGISLSMWSTGKQTGVLGLNLLLSSTEWSTMGSRIRFYYLLSKFYPMKI